jgi:hypothetical protein
MQAAAVLEQPHQELVVLRVVAAAVLVLGMEQVHQALQILVAAAAAQLMQLLVEVVVQELLFLNTQTFTP